MVPPEDVDDTEGVLRRDGSHRFRSQYNTAADAREGKGCGGGTGPGGGEGGGVN